MATQATACPNCGGEIVDFAAYKDSVTQDENRGDVFPEEDPTGGVQVCSQCAMAFLSGEEEENTQIPEESPEHMPGWEPGQEQAEPQQTDLSPPPEESADSG
jgi:hypothetical protein